MYQFQCAKPVWGSGLKNQYNQFLGFFAEIEVQKSTQIKIAITARSCYRLFLNGVMAANGPARTAEGYCRVDEITLSVSGKINIAVEVAAYDKAGKYCNDRTMEPGLFIAEITGEDDKILAATGAPGWKYLELTTRRDLVETMSHARGIIEYYDLDPMSFSWRMGKEDMRDPILLHEDVTYLIRRAPCAKYRRIRMSSLQGISDMVPDSEGSAGFPLKMARLFNREWYAMLPKENCFLESLCKEQEAVYSGTWHIERDSQGLKSVILNPGSNPAALIWGRDSSELGYIDFEVEAEKECVIDILNSDHRDFGGSLPANTYVSRYHLMPGKYHLTDFEPKLIRYIKMIFRTEGSIRVFRPEIVDDSYPDQKEIFFQSSDGDLNRIYEGARRTLRLGTLDIFMDCPQRERGGWLCDSYFSAYAAWQLFGDLRVEKDFLENFLLTDPDQFRNAFFPEVYPGSRKDPSEIGIENWSFWLMLELAAYYERSGDRNFIDLHRERVSRFMEGVLKLRGESGLLEGLRTPFVDWSISNSEYCVQPISVPINCLAVRMLESLGALYGEAAWTAAGRKMRGIIEAMDKSPGILGSSGDSAVFENGILRRTGPQTESGAALEVWSGFHREDTEYIRRFKDAMGTNSRFRADPNIARSNLFIGLMIRMEALAQMGETRALTREMKSIYLPELQDGPGTFFENYNELSGCHTFNGAAGALLVNKVLGLGSPEEGTKTIRISPHPGELRWAAGSAGCTDGLILLSWSADHDRHQLEIRLDMPRTWKYTLDIPFELVGWMILINGKIFAGRWNSMINDPEA